MVKSIRRSQKELDARAALARMQHALEQEFEADEDDGSNTAVRRLRRSGITISLTIISPQTQAHKAVVWPQFAWLPKGKIGAC